MKNEEKPDGRGKYAIMTWKEIRKVGGLSYSPEQITAILERGGENMLTREEVQQRISAYLQSCITLSQDEESGEFNYVWKRNPTKAALALSLGIDAGTLCDYIRGQDRHGNKYKHEGENKGIQKIATADFDLLRKACTLIESFYEEQLAVNKNNSGVIFWLLNKENRKWSNEQEFKLQPIEQPSCQVMSADELPDLEKYFETKRK